MNEALLFQFHKNMCYQTIITVLVVEKGQLFDTGQIVKVGMVLHADFASTEVH